MTGIYVPGWALADELYQNHKVVERAFERLEAEHKAAIDCRREVNLPAGYPRREAYANRRAYRTAVRRWHRQRD